MTKSLRIMCFGALAALWAGQVSAQSEPLATPSLDFGSDKPVAVQAQAPASTTPLPAKPLAVKPVAAAKAKPKSKAPVRRASDNRGKKNAAVAAGVIAAGVAIGAALAAGRERRRAEPYYDPYWDGAEAPIAAPPVYSQPVPVQPSYVQYPYGYAPYYGPRANNRYVYDPVSGRWIDRWAWHTQPQVYPLPHAYPSPYVNPQTGYGYQPHEVDRRTLRAWRRDYRNPYLPSSPAPMPDPSPAK